MKRCAVNASSSTARVNRPLAERRETARVVICACVFRAHRTCTTRAVAFRHHYTFICFAPIYICYMFGVNWYLSCNGAQGLLLELSAPTQVVKNPTTHPQHFKFMFSCLSAGDLSDSAGLGSYQLCRYAVNASSSTARVNRPLAERKETARVVSKEVSLIQRRMLHFNNNDNNAALPFC